jgi:hypothetical protein
MVVQLKIAGPFNPVVASAQYTLGVLERLSATIRKASLDRHNTAGMVIDDPGKTMKAVMLEAASVALEDLADAIDAQIETERKDGI